MRDSDQSKAPKFGESAMYRIIVAGSVGDVLRNRIGGMDLETSNPEESPSGTVLIGQMMDQAELNGVLNTIYQLHLPIVAVEHVTDDSPE